MSVSPDAKPKLPRGVRLTHNEAQGGWVLLAPERVFKADAIAAEIVKRCTGEATVTEIVDDLAKTFNAPRDRIETDVTAMLTGLADKKLIETLMDATPQRAPRPLGLLAELTHRCPLGCPYCSNPLALEGRADELDTASWARVFREAAALGVLQVHLSGGEPAARRDLVELTKAAHDAGLYTNLITSAVGITRETFAQALRCRARSRADLHPGQRARHRRSHRRLQGRLCAQAGARRRSDAARHSADRQCRDAPRQHRPCRARWSRSR